jgi:hypothetical protein
MASNGQSREGRHLPHDPHRAPGAAHQRQLLPPHGLPGPQESGVDLPTLPSLGRIPGLARARLPATYEVARHALAECDRIDECKSWSDKAAALASYARQARDYTLRMMAERIQARAVRRCGELLKEVPSGQGSRNQHGEVRDRGVTRRKAAHDAGLSERQKVTALRVATIPPPDFEALMEAEPPPTVTQLADLGRCPRVVEPPTNHHGTEAGAKSRTMFATIRRFCEQNLPAELAKEFTSQDAQSLREFVAELERWLEEFAKNLPEGEGATSSRRLSATKRPGTPEAHSSKSSIGTRPTRHAG